MTWNYRILQHDDGTIAIHEVYYNEVGEPYMYGLDAIASGNNVGELIKELALVLNDVGRSMHEIIEASIFTQADRTAEVYIDCDKGSGHEHA